MVKVTVIIRTTGMKSKVKLLRATISSLARQSFKDFSVIVVTCKNKKYIESLLQESFSHNKFKVVISPIRNRCVQSNIGIKLSDSEYVVVIDDDMVLSSNWLETMFNAITNSPPEVACICSPVYSLYRDRSPYDVHARSLSYLKILRKFLRLLSISTTFWPKNTKPLSQGFKEIPTIPSNCMICRCTALIDVGLYDTALQEPLRGDDYDLGFRLRKIGYKIISCDAVKAFHTENYLTKWLGKEPEFFKNMASTELYVLTKHRKFVGLDTIILHSLYRVIESLYWAYKNKKPAVTLSVLKGIVEGIAQGLKFENSN
ncbi:MAG: hypothetical protein DRZ82_09800 [Thermoprotei archaeon]|nr:MAG: hypothetical protein DRZ82_09800 [Thermoprotei archaeon]